MRKFIGVWIFLVWIGIIVLTSPLFSLLPIWMVFVAIPLLAGAVNLILEPKKKVEQVEIYAEPTLIIDVDVSKFDDIGKAINAAWDKVPSMKDFPYRVLIRLPKGTYTYKTPIKAFQNLKPVVQNHDE